MTLRRKISLQIIAMIAGILLVAAAALWGMRGLRIDFSAASAGYRELRERYEIGFHVAIARMLLQADKPDADRAATEISAALTMLDVLESQPDPHLRRDHELTAVLKTAARGLQLANDPALHEGEPSPIDSLNRALGQITASSLETRKEIADAERAAHDKWRHTLTTVGILSAAVVLVAIALGVWQYRAVIHPLRRLGDAANRIAAGELSGRVATTGPREFAQLAADFNRMATELESLYRDLEAKVAATSKELVRSERLASVGYLAAGVAHEINNPLSVITGYAERAIQQLERSTNGDPATPLALKNLRVVCEEAYRCKQITDQLLAMARKGTTGEADRGAVSLGALAREVIGLIEPLPVHRDRTVMFESAVDATVLGSAGELKQVLLNLLVNALEAVPAGGRVNVRLAADNGVARLTVADNGRGMTPEVLEKVFEPFFTDKRGASHPGTGLGLSIAHAIVTAHGGRLIAQSAGPDRGSTFMIELSVHASTSPLSL